LTWRRSKLTPLRFRHRRKLRIRSLVLLLPREPISLGFARRRGTRSRKFAHSNVEQSLDWFSLVLELCRLLQKIYNSKL